MNQRRMILTVVAIGIASAAAIWVWKDSSQQIDVARAPVKAAPPLQDAFHQPSSAPAASTEPPAAASAPPLAAPPPSTVSDVNQAMASAQVEPANVDPPEPAERKFARGGRADEASQN